MATAFFLFLTVVFGVGCLVLTSILLGMRHEQREAKSLKRKSLNEIKTARFDQHNAREVISGCESIKADAIRATQDATDRVARMGSYIIAEQSGEHIKAIKANNYHAKEKKILRSIEVAAKNGYHLPADEQQQLTRMLKQAHEKALKAEAEKQKQAAIKEQMREEERAQREFDRAIKKAEEERKKKEREAQIRRKAMEDAIKILGDTHSEQLDELKKQLADAEQEAEEARLAAERTKSMAEQTKRGHIYIISNIGSFGKDMYKVGMTRRLEPMDRVKELGDASVPFTFDVHAMISSDNAPSLESALHRRLSDYRVNRINFRKEFFRTPIETIIQAVEAEHGVIEYQADPEALEYFESLDIANESGTLEERITAEASLEEQN